MSSAYDLVAPDAGDTERAAEAALRPTPWGMARMLSMTDLVPPRPLHSAGLR